MAVFLCRHALLTCRHANTSCDCVETGTNLVYNMDRLEFPPLVIGLLSLYLLLIFLSYRIVCSTKTVHLKENGQAIRSNLCYFLSLLDHYIKSYSCFSVEHHLFALKCHPLSEPLEHTKNSNLQNSINILSCDFFPWNHHNKANICEPSDQQNSIILSYISYGILLMP
jgi:hypothetical protein